MQGRVILRPGREKAVLRRHPWVFSGAVARIEGRPADGDVVDVLADDGTFLAQGYLNRRSQIVVRLLTWAPEERIDEGFWRQRLEIALRGRASLLAEERGACRLVHAESDGLPGLVVDRYGAFLVVQFLALGVDQRRHLLVEALADLLRPQGIYERDDEAVREKEGLPLQTGVLWGEEPPGWVEMEEGGLRFLVDLREGHKTGFYLDQRENRARLLRYAAGREVLNAFAYTGAFGLYALRGGAAHVVNVDTSERALDLARRNFARNGWGEGRAEFVAGDVFQVLRRYRQEGRQFDLIVLDPPKFAHSAADVPAATRGYKDINLLAFQLLREGGVLFTFSCSGAISVDLFQKVVFRASLDAGRDVQVLERLTQSSDHPVLLSFPEGEYLKGLVCRVVPFA
ncbi:MAG: class I SAM-dependent rRNA methyltransferase [Anaerolineae bacterium]